MPIWVYVCISTLVVIGIVAFVLFGKHDWYFKSVAKPTEPSPAPAFIAPELPIAEAEPESLTLDDICITVIRIGADITVLLNWGNTSPEIPFHLSVSTENGTLILNSPNNEPRKVEVLPNQAITLYGSTLHHEASDNRLTIDLQVETEGEQQ